MIDDTMLATLCAVGSPKEVAADVAARFGGLVERVGFYTPYLIDEGTLGEMVDRARASDVRERDGAGMSPSPADHYDEFSLFEENATEAGLPWSGPPAVRAEFVEVAPGRNVSALVWGNRPPDIVFVHGGGQNAHTWDTVALALDRPLVAIDLPGHGHSDWPGDARASIHGPWPRTSPS